jgi:hypothetical protein
MLSQSKYPAHKILVFEFPGGLRSMHRKQVEHSSDLRHAGLKISSTYQPVGRSHELPDAPREPLLKSLIRGLLE